MRDSPPGQITQVEKKIVYAQITRSSIFGKDDPLFPKQTSFYLQNHICGAHIRRPL